MIRFASSALLILLTLALIAGCSGEGEKEEPKVDVKKSTVPWEITPEFTKEALNVFRHPVRDNNNPFVTLETTMGSMTLELYHDVAPAHVDSFVARTMDGHYDSTLFHRVVEHFMIQGGGFNVEGQYKQIGYMLADEHSKLPHYEGTLSMARTARPNTAGTQFFVCLNRNQYTTSLDNQYTVFGQLIKGYDVLHAIGAAEVERQPGGGEESKPVEKIVLLKAYVSDADGNPL